MIIDLHLGILLILFIIIVLIMTMIDIIKKRIHFETIVIKNLFALYLLLLIKITILPIWIDVVYMPQVNIMEMIQFVPFHTIIENLTDGYYIPIIGNILLLMPLIIGISLLKSEKISKKKLLVIGVACSLLIEMVQLITDIITKTNAHILDIDDVILNIVGIILSLLLVDPVKRLWKRMRIR